MSRAWRWLLVAVWLLALFAELIPFSWRAAVLIIPVSICLVGLLHFTGAGLWRPPGYAALVGWFALLLIQFLPLPPAILSFLTPGGHQLYSQTVWVLRPDTWLPLALTVKPAFLWLLQFMVTAGIFYMTAHFGSDHIGLGKFLQWFGLAVGLVALATIGAGFILVADGSMATVFKTGLVSLAAFVPLVLACHLYAKPHQNYGTWRNRLFQALRHPLNHLHGYLLASALVMVLAVLSFGPLRIQVALACGLLMMTVLLLLRRSTRTGCMAAVVLSLLVTIVVGLGTIKSTHRDAENSSVPAFTSLDRHSLVKDFVLFGAGPGNLSELEMRYTHLTSTPAEKKSLGFGLAVLSQGGLAGAFLTLCFWFMVLPAGVAGWLRRRNRMAQFILPGVCAGLIVCFATGSGPHQVSGPWPGLAGYFLAALLLATGCFSSSGNRTLNLVIYHRLFGGR